MTFTKSIIPTDVRIHLIMGQSLFVISYFTDAFGLAQIFREQAYLLSQDGYFIRQNDNSYIHIIYDIL